MRHTPDDKPTEGEQRDQMLSVLNRIARALEDLSVNAFTTNGPGPNTPPPEPPPPPQPPNPGEG